MSRVALPRGGVLLALLGRHLRTMRRSRMLIWLGIITVTIWLGAADEPTSSIRILASAEIVGALAALIAGAGILASEYDTGGMILDRLHGARALELAGAAIMHVALITVLCVILYCTLTLFRGTQWLDSRLAVAGPILVLELLGWVSFVTFLGAIAPAYGNSVLAFAFVLMDVTRELPGFPAAVRTVLSALHWGVPTPMRLGDVVDSVHPGAGISGAALLPASVWIPLGVVLTVMLLNRTEPATRWRR